MKYINRTFTDLKFTKSKKRKTKKKLDDKFYENLNKYKDFI